MKNLVLPARLASLIVLVLPLTIVSLYIAGCSPVETQAYRTVVGANAFLKSVSSQHPECKSGLVSDTCTKLSQAVGAKDLLIDAVEAYCAGPQFQTGGVCQPPAKGTPAATQAAAKLQAAINAYNQAQTDLKKAAGN